MTDREIYDKAMDKALKNKWIGAYEYFDPVTNDGRGHYRVIFSHEFATAFWGEKWIENPIFDEDGGQINDLGIKAWEHHLQQMVLEEEPLKYLEKFL